jgi:D-alanyl-D-alanine carboxypeptidase
VPVATAARLERALERASTSLLLPGVAATVIFPDGSSWSGALGLADAAAGRRVSASTPFAIASVTKTFTAALVLHYVDEGRLGLDDSLSRWVPAWPNARRVTIRMLLNHTSGIPDFFVNPALETALNRDRRAVWTTADVLAGYVGRGALFAPGTGWSYSNTNYLLLGLVAGRVGGAPWPDLVRREFLDPLGLAATYVQGVEEPPAAPARGHRLVAGDDGARPVVWTDGTDVVPFTSVVTAAGAAGAMASTSGDLARWARALYGGYILRRETRTEMLTFVRSTAYGRETSYGLGVSRVSFGDRSAYGHTGALAGTRAAIRYFPEEGAAIAVLFNRDTFTGDDVVRILAWAVFPDAPASPSPALSPSPAPGESPAPSPSPIP